MSGECLTFFLRFALAVPLAIGATGVAAQSRATRAPQNVAAGEPLQLATAARGAQGGSGLRLGLHPHGPLAEAVAPRPVRKIKTAPTHRGPRLAASKTRPAQPGQDTDPAPTGAIAPDAGPDAGELARAYCAAIAAPVTDARSSWQANKMRELEAALEKRAQELSARIEEMRGLMAARDEAARKAEENVIAIYAKMKPESAAAQLSAMDEMSAAAVLGRLNPRAASLILNEITPDKAARLTGAMTLRRRANPGEKGA